MYLLHILLITIIFSSVNLYAKSTLPEIIQIAIDNNSRLKSFMHAALEKKHLVGPASSYPDPKLQYEYSNMPLDSLRSDRSPMSGRELRLIQKIPFPGKLSKLKRSKVFDYKASVHIFNEEQLLVIMNVKKTYYNLFLVYKKIELVTHTKEFLRQTVKVAKNRYKVGKSNQNDVIQMQVKLSEIEKELAMLAIELSIVQAKLNLLLSRDANLKFEQPEEITLTDYDFENTTIDSLFKGANKSRSKLLAFNDVVESRRAYKNYRFWGHMPDFEVGIKYRIRTPNMQDDGKDFGSVFVGINLPIFSPWKQSENYKHASQQLLKVKAQKEYFVRLLRNQIYQAYSQAKEQKKIIKIYSAEIIPKAEQSLTWSKTAYRLGNINYLLLLEAEKTLYRNKINYHNTRVLYEKAIVEMEAKIGKPISKWY